MDAGARPQPRRRPEPRGLAPLGWLAALVLLVAMALPLLQGRVYTYDDLGCFHLPVRAFYSQQLARHEPFDWMPQLFCGFYLTGEGQAGTYHPWHYLLYRLAPLDVAWPLEVLSSYPLMLVGTWLLLRRRLRPEAAAFGSLGFAFSAFNLLHFVHPNAIAIVAHIPWLLWAIDVVLSAADSRRRAWALLAIALLTGSQLLLGYPQYVWFSLLAETAWVGMLFRLPRRASPGGGPWPLLGWLAGAKLLGLVLGAVQILPTVDALAHAARRAVKADFANQGALHAFNLVQLVSPYFFAERAVGITPHEAALYLGAVPLALLVWLYTTNTARRLPGTGMLGLLGIVALVLAFGPAGQLYRLQQFLPLVNSFRCPCRYLVLFQLAMMVLAAGAFGQLAAQCRRGQRAEWRELRGLLVLVAVALLVMLVGFGLRGHVLIASRRLMLAGAGLTAAAGLLVAMATRGHRLALAGLVVLAAADLGIYGLSYAVFRDAEPLDHYATLPLVPPGKPTVRMAADLLPFGDWAPRSGNQMLLAGWSRVDGYAGLEPARQLNYQTLAALRVAGVGWVRRSPTTDAIPGLTIHDAHWLSVPEPLPYVRLASIAKLSAQSATDLPNIPIESTVLVEQPVELPRGPNGQARLIDHRPQRISIEVHAPAQRLLAVAESFHTGWVATVDGRLARPLRVNGDFLGCLVDGGRHQVVLEFRPHSLAVGQIVSLAGLGLVLLASLWLIARSRPRLV